MAGYSEVPYRFQEFENKSAFFVTYFGDIYYGSICRYPGYHDGFFIIRNDRRREADSFDFAGKSVDDFRMLGWEIKDHRVITDAFEDVRFHKSAPRSVHFSGQQFKQMFIFGAGASTFCVFGNALEKFRKTSYNPPTGFEIFDEKYKTFFEKYPGCISSLPEWESRGRDIEALLDDEIRKCKEVFRPDVIARHANIQFYLQELFRSISSTVILKEYRYNLYGLFCSKLQERLASKSNEVALIVSFNYDTILDHFIEKLSAPFKSITDYFDWERRNIVLFKPHGSCDWGWKFRRTFENSPNRDALVANLHQRQTPLSDIFFYLLGDMNQTVEYSSWGVEGKYSLNKDLITRNSENNDTVHYPALLLPYRDKDEFVMPYHMQHAMTSCFNQVAELFLIGWKGNEYLFNQKLKSNAHSLRKITIVNPHAEDVKSNLKKAGLDLSQYELQEIKTFENFVLSHLE